MTEEISIDTPIDAGVYKIKAFNRDLYLTVDVFTTILGNKNAATEWQVEPVGTGFSIKDRFSKDLYADVNAIRPSERLDIKTTLSTHWRINHKTALPEDAYRVTATADHIGTAWASQADGSVVLHAFDIKDVNQIFLFEKIEV